MRTAILAVLVYLLAMPAAHAYVDPGSSMLLIQGAIALVGGIIAFVRHPVRKIRALFKRLFGKRDA